MSRALREGHGVKDTDLRLVMDGLESIAHTTHEREAEQALYPLLRERIPPARADRLDHLRSEHAELHALFEEVGRLAGPAVQGDLRARERLAKATERYVEALHRHLDEEEHVAISHLDEALDRRALQALSEGMAEIREAGELDRPDQYEPHLQRLSETYHRYL